MEQIFLRIRKPGPDGAVAVIPVKAELAFEVNGHRFMYHTDGVFGEMGFAKITDARTGNSIRSQLPFERKEDFICSVEKMVRERWDVYLLEVKKIQREMKPKWGRI